MSKEILSIIPAKGTSKGLPGKNLYPLFGKPLVQWTIEASIRSGYATRTVVSSDSTEILDLAQTLGAEIIERPIELATDTASSESVIEHAIEYLAATEGYHPEVLILLQPTSPLRTSLDIDEAILYYVHSNASALISGYEPPHNPFKDFIIDQDGTLRAIVDDSYPFLPRQRLPASFRPNGAIYIIKTDSFMATQSLLTENTVPFFMDRDKSIDVDNISDLMEAESYMSKLVPQSAQNTL
jgi:CMP-N,N'-diacetyllegionaminic acid synthase